MQSYSGLVIGLDSPGEIAMIASAFAMDLVELSWVIGAPFVRASFPY